jgi:hypothetical protein
MWIPIQPVTVENSCLQLTNSPLPSSQLFDGARRGSLALSVPIEPRGTILRGTKGISHWRLLLLLAGWADPVTGFTGIDPLIWESFEPVSCAMDVGDVSSCQQHWAISAEQWLSQQVNAGSC